MRHCLRLPSSAQGRCQPSSSRCSGHHAPQRPEPWRPRRRSFCAQRKPSRPGRTVDLPRHFSAPLARHLAACRFRKRGRSNAVALPFIPGGKLENCPLLPFHWEGPPRLADQTKTRESASAPRKPFRTTVQSLNRRGEAGVFDFSDVSAGARAETASSVVISQ